MGIVSLPFCDAMTSQQCWFTGLECISYASVTVKCLRGQYCYYILSPRPRQPPTAPWRRQDKPLPAWFVNAHSKLIAPLPIACSRLLDQKIPSSCSSCVYAQSCQQYHGKGLPVGHYQAVAYYAVHAFLRIFQAVSYGACSDLRVVERQH